MTLNYKKAPIPILTSFTLQLYNSRCPSFEIFEKGFMTMTLHKIRALYVFLIFSVCLACAAEKQPAEAIKPSAPVPTVAVNNFEARGISEDEAATLTDVFRTRLMKTEKYQVMERGQMEAILKEQAFQQSGVCTDQECIVEMGQILGIEQIIAGSLGKVGNAYSINVRIISVETGKIVNSCSHSYTGPIENLLTSEIAVVVNRLAGIETVYEPRAPKKREHNTKKLRRNLIIAGLSAAAVGAGVAALLIIRKNEETATLEVIWEKP